MNEFQFHDPYLQVSTLLHPLSLCAQLLICIFYHSQQKYDDNELAMKHLPSRLDSLQHMSWIDRQINLVKGILAGNVFDWGAKEVVAMMSSEKFDFEDACKKLQRKTLFHPVSHRIFKHHVF